MSDADMALVDRGALLLPVTAGGVVLAYNLPGFEGDLKLSRAAYAGIFLGEIKNWNDPAIAKTNPGVRLPRLTIATVVRQDRSGTTFAFTNHLSAMSPEMARPLMARPHYVNWPGNAMRATGNEGVAGRIKQSVGSIGYVGYEFARRLGLNARSHREPGRQVRQADGRELHDGPRLRVHAGEPPRLHTRPGGRGILSDGHLHVDSPLQEV